MKKPIQNRAAFLGLGKMGSILLDALLRQGILSPKRVVATVRHQTRADQLTRQFNVPVKTDNVEAARQADLILLCVRPNIVREVIPEIASEMTRDKPLVSIAASVPTDYIERTLKAEVPIVRAMPNTPCAIGCGITGICKGRFVRRTHLELVTAIFESVGKTVIMDEKHMDAVTGLSASGPAFIYVILESLAEAGVKVGLPRDMATLLAAQTAQGAARVILETRHHPALLKDAVMTPAGCTIDGILELEEGKLRVTLIKAVVRATHRAKELLLAD